MAKILFGDDDESIRLLYSCMYRHHESSVVKTPYEMIEHAGRTDYDLIVTDYHYGEKLNGMDIAMQIRQKNPDVPIIINTATLTESLEQRANAIGVKVLDKTSMLLREVIREKFGKN